MVWCEWSVSFGPKSCQWWWLWLINRKMFILLPLDKKSSLIIKTTRQNTFTHLLRVHSKRIKYSEGRVKGKLDKNDPKRWEKSMLIRVILENTGPKNWDYETLSHRSAWETPSQDVISHIQWSTVSKRDGCRDGWRNGALKIILRAGCCGGNDNIPHSHNNLSLCDVCTNIWEWSCTQMSRGW